MFSSFNIDVTDLWSRRWCSPLWCCGSALAGAAGWAPPPGGCSLGDTTRISGHQSCAKLKRGVTSQELEMEV